MQRPTSRLEGSAAIASLHEPHECLHWSQCLPSRLPHKRHVLMICPATLCLRSDSSGSVSCNRLPSATFWLHEQTSGCSEHLRREKFRAPRRGWEPASFGRCQERRGKFFRDVHPFGGFRTKKRLYRRKKFRKAVPSLRTWVRIETKHRVEGMQNGTDFIADRRLAKPQCTRVLGGDGLSCRRVRQRRPCEGYGTHELTEVQ